MKNIVVLDTETTCGFATPLIYDFGYVIINPKGEVLLTKHFLIKEIFDTKELMDKAYYSTKVKDYRQMFADGLIQKESFKNSIKQFVADCKKHKVSVISAYNIAFDMRALNQTLRVLFNENYENGWLSKFFSQKNKKLLCIYNLACETILNTDEYREFATQNEMVSSKGNYKTNAECAYAYLTNNPQFEEKHTALEDVKIEIEILLKILSEYRGNIEYGLHYGSWRKVQVKSQK